ncbi:MAG: hypothetical protein IJG18_13620, partial [Kiritimatiellae bacterium]|nr:hypothetical protein [Kiritimatiellia bacterium]
MKSSRQRFKARRVADFVVALSAVVLLTHYAATKPTNQLENCEIVELWNSGNGKLRNGGATGITVDDVERGYAVSLAKTNETCSFAMPAGAEEARRWRIRGASSDWIAFDAGG